MSTRGEIPHERLRIPVAIDNTRERDVFDPAGSWVEGLKGGWLLVECCFGFAGSEFRRALDRVLMTGQSSREGVLPTRELTEAAGEKAPTTSTRRMGVTPDPLGNGGKRNSMLRVGLFFRCGLRSAVDRRLVHQYPEGAMSKTSCPRDRSTLART